MNDITSWAFYNFYRKNNLFYSMLYRMEHVRMYKIGQPFNLYLG